MKLCLEIAAFAFTALSGVLFLIASRLPLTPIKPGLEGLDDVPQFSSDLRTIGKWSVWSAVTLAIGLLLQATKLGLDVFDATKG
jgi:hypothetical protein